MAHANSGEATASTGDPDEKEVSGMHVLNVLASRGRLTKPELVAPEYARYISHAVSTFSLDRMGSELELMHENLQRNKAASQALARDNYRSFVRTSECIAGMQTRLDHMTSHQLVHMSETITNLSTHFHKFLEDGKQFLAKSRNSSTILNNLQSVIEILEIPQLMDACIRNQAYEEALVLSQHARKQLNQNPSIKLLQLIASETSQLEVVLQQYIEQSLCTPLQLPSVAKSVLLLKKMDVYSPQELRFTFLACKKACFMSSVAPLQETNPYNYLTTVVDKFREHMFDCVTQYRALFLVQGASNTDMEVSSLLYSYVTQQVSWLHDTISLNISRISELSLVGTLADQTMYAAASLAHSGLDFRGVFLPIFSQRIISVFGSSVSEAAQQFAQDLPNYKPISFTPKSPTTTIQPQGLLNTPSSDSNITLSSNAPLPSPSPSSPPSSLADYLPVSTLTNKVLAALNELRSCAATAIIPQLSQVLTQAFQIVVSAVVSCVTTHQTTVPSSSPSGIVSLALVVCDTMIPYLSKSFDTVYHAEAPLINTTNLTSPLSSLLPRITPPETLPEPPSSTSIKAQDQQTKQQPTESPSELPPVTTTQPTPASSE
ncbi:conserved oligomeric Golgi complex subunit 8 [Pelomyxa schiedti]|nr:conserved oligomeric Golgi complex subunit 8 [Pelomyxa schiedti]